MTPVSRRTFIASVVGAVGAAAAGDAFLVEPTAIAVTRHDVPVPGLPTALDGLRIANLTDVHLDAGVHRPALIALERLAAERVDVVVLSGDICNRGRALPDLTAWARDARGTLGTFATFGNWERDAPISRERLARAYDRAGIELLVNSRGRVHARGVTLTIIGLDDPVAGSPDLIAALGDVSASDVSVWVLHGPGYVDTVRRATTPTPALILSGHTHGGQIRLPFYTPYTPTGSGRFVAGWYRDTLAPLHVSRGIGTVGIPARLFCPPELPVFTLRPA